MSTTEITEDYEDVDVKDVLRMLEKQDDLLDIQRTIIQLLLLSGFLTFLLLIFLVYRLNLHYKFHNLLLVMATNLNKTDAEQEQPKDTKVAMLVLTKPVKTVENMKARSC